MIAVAKWLHLVALGVWLGSIVFFSFAVAPLVFSALPRADAGRVVSAIFPTYYFIGYACGAALLLTALLLRASTASAMRSWNIVAAVTALTLAVTLYAGLVVQPRAHALRASLAEAGQDSPVKAEFDNLHRRAVQLNGSALIGVLILSGLAAARLRP
jgi:hypothetical protein